MSSLGDTALSAIINYNPAARVLGNQNLRAEVAQHQALTEQQNALTQQEQMKTQGMQIELRDRQALDSAWASTGGDPTKMQSAYIKAGGGPSGLYGFLQNTQKYINELATGDKTRLENEASITKQQGDIYGALSQVPAEQRAGMVPETIQRLQRIDPRGMVPTAEQLLNDDWLKTQNGRTGYAARLQEEALKRAQTAQAQATTQKTEQENVTTRRAQSASDLQAITDPATGVPNPAAFAAWNATYKDVLPGAVAPTKEGIGQYVRAVGVAPKDQPTYDINQLKAQNGITGTSEFDTVFLPAYAAKLGKKINQLSPDEKMASFSAYTQAKADPELKEARLASVAQLAAIRTIAQQQHEAQRGQQSYQFSAGELDRLGKPIEDLNARFGRLKDTLAQNSPQADALIAPELMTVMAGGQGSGLRINEAEINRVVGGRSKWQDLQAAINKWQLDPKKANSITPEQRQQIHGLIDMVGQKLTQKQALLNDARQALSGSNDPMEHRRIISGLHQKMSTIDTPATPATVKLRAPDGTVKDVPPDQVDHFLKLGAQKVP
jgi:hypothetical protein